ncbi:glycosyltransferase family 2 protein [Congregicoccus parvus]|uniref:glycosyltransferase family 2 protein n=1 Tax=Congregicoccus parvus TaxID=3081749 RepID=UPI003FA5B004
MVKSTRSMAHFVRPMAIGDPARPGRWLVLDVIVCRDFVELVCPLYPDRNVGADDFSVTVDGAHVAFVCERVLGGFESARVLKFEVSVGGLRENCSVCVTCLGCAVERTVTLSGGSSRSGLAVATIFRDDLREIRRFVAYYSSLGFETFYLFFNGRIEDVADSLPVIEGVVYGEWCFPYYLDDSSWRPEFGGLVSALRRAVGAIRGCGRRLRHHSQPPFIEMIRLRFLKNHDWLLFCDLDEYLFGSKRLDDVLASSDKDYLCIQSFWASVKPPGGRILRIGFARRLCGLWSKVVRGFVYCGGAVSVSAVGFVGGGC